MCGRMTLTRSAEEIAQVFELASEPAALAEPDGLPLRPRYNIAPSQPVLTVVRSEGGVRGFAWKTWGLLPGWAPDPSIGSKLFNARGETVDAKPSFRSAFKRSRCLVVADGFYEWSARSRGHRPYWFHPREGGLLAFAGLHEHSSVGQGPAIDSCTVITTEANEDLAGVHARMPVVLSKVVWKDWLDPDSELDDLKRLLVPAPAGTLLALAVSRRVNEPRHDDPHCLDPAPEEGASGSFRLDGG